MIGAGSRSATTLTAQDRNRFNYEAAGIFLNHVNYADMRFGGGSVVINGLPQVVAPIEMLDSRPTLTFNRITFSADAAMAASPNSFAETNFHEPAIAVRPVHFRLPPCGSGNARQRRDG